jgi:hypothetical protein
MKGSKSSLTITNINVFWFFIFAYFVTLSADLLCIQIYLFRPKLNHLIAICLFGFFFLCKKIWILHTRLSIAFLLLLSSLIISSFFSHCYSRSVAYVFISVFTFCVFFLLPMNLMLFCDRQKLMRVYFLSFVCMGVYALIQLVLSFFGIYDPHAHQKAAVTIARGQGLSLEPSFYALYALPFVMFYNTKKILSSFKIFNFKFLFSIFFVNVLLIASTSSSVFFAYVLFLVFIILLIRTKEVERFFINCRIKIIKTAVVFASIFLLFSVYFYQLFLDTFFKFFYVGFFAHQSFLERWEGIVNAWNVFCEYPLLGVGLGGVGPYIYLQQNGIALTNPTLDMFDLIDPKNVLTEVLASLGLYGLGVLLFFGWTVLSIFRGILKDSRLTEEDRMTIFSLFISIVVMMACLQINQGLFRSHIWVHMGIAVGYILSIKTEWKKDLLRN